MTIPPNGRQSRTRLSALMLSLPIAIALALAPLPALAHKVIASVFPSGTAIEGEIGFSSGDMAVAQRVEVFDAQGNRLGETVTDNDGFFLFTPVSPVTHVFRAELGSGHVAEARLDASEVARIVGKGQSSIADSDPNPGAGATIAYGGTASEPAATPAAGATIAYAPTVTVAALSDEERTAIAEIVRNETRPLRQEIAAYKEKNDLQTILGGIGYIVGLFGLGFYVAARRKLKDST